MSKLQNIKLNSTNNKAELEKLLKPLSKKEQQTVTGGWSRRSSSASSGSFW